MADNIEVTENTETAASQEPTVEKTFTQAEMDAIITRRLARAMKGMPDEGEIADFRAWKQTQPETQRTMAQLVSERDTAK